MSVDPLHLAYLAGVVDADGFITIQRAVKQKSAGGKTPYHSLKLGITGGRPAPHELAVSIFGGTIHTHRPKTKRYLPQHQWVVHGDTAAEVARALVPHLRVKPGQALLGIRFQAMMRAQIERRRHTQTPPYRVTATMLAEREGLWREMVALNDAKYRQRESAAALARPAAPKSLDLFDTRLDGRTWDEFPTAPTSIRSTA